MVVPECIGNIYEFQPVCGRSMESSFEKTPAGKTMTDFDELRQKVNLLNKEDFDAARAIRNSEPVSSSDLPDEIAEPPCPKCGSRKVTEKAEIVESLDDSRSHSPTPRQMWLYKCGVCGHKWSNS